MSGGPVSGTKLVIAAVALAAGGFVTALAVSNRIGVVGGPRGGRFYARVAAAQQPAGAELPVMGTVPYFELTSTSGKPVTRADLAGKVWIADFIFTRCTGPCNAMTTRMLQLSERLKQDAGVQLVTITVDPERDKPADLAQYAGLNKADANRWWFLTGSKEAIYRLSREGFKLGAGEVAKGAPEYATMPFFHSTRFVLVDQQARIRGYYEGVDPEALRKLLGDARALVHSGGAAADSGGGRAAAAAGSVP